MTFKQECRRDCMESLTNNNSPYWAKRGAFEILWIISSLSPKYLKGAARMWRFKAWTWWTWLRFKYIIFKSKILREVWNMRFFFLCVYDLLGIKLDGPKN